MKKQSTSVGNKGGRRLAQSIAAASLAVAFTVGTATAAHAEGNWSSDMTQVQPTFESRRWADNNIDAAHTVITLSNCKGNAKGKKSGTTAITSVKIQLEDGPAITHKCGTYDFGRLPAGTTTFKVAAINGKTGADRKIFLNADVKVSF